MAIVFLNEMLHQNLSYCVDSTCCVLAPSGFYISMIKDGDICHNAGYYCTEHFWHDGVVFLVFFFFLVISLAR